MSSADDHSWFFIQSFTPDIKAAYSSSSCLNSSSPSQNNLTWELYKALARFQAARDEGDILYWISLNSSEPAITLMID
jgi:hypothetical protein